MKLSLRDMLITPGDVFLIVRAPQPGFGNLWWCWSPRHIGILVEDVRVVLMYGSEPEVRIHERAINDCDGWGTLNGKYSSFLKFLEKGYILRV